MKKKRTFCKTFRSLGNVLKLQCLVDDLLDILQLSVFINGSLPYILYLIKEIEDSDMKKKAFCYIATMYIVFSQNTINDG